MSQSLLRLPQVVARCGYKRSSIYAKVRSGEFPAPIPLGPRLVVWPSDAIDEWVTRQIELGRNKRGDPDRGESIAAVA